MPLFYAPLCTRCGKVKTQHPSGLCARCRRKNVKMPTPCKVCGQINTSSPDGICNRCKRRSVAKNYGISILDDAIEQYETTLLVLQKRKEGKTFREIGEELSIPKSTVYNYFNTAINAFQSPSSDKFADPKITPQKQTDDDAEDEDVVEPPKTSKGKSKKQSG